MRSSEVRSSPSRRARRSSSRTGAESPPNGWTPDAFSSVGDSRTTLKSHCSLASFVAVVAAVLVLGGIARDSDAGFIVAGTGVRLEVEQQSATGMTVHLH